MFCMIRATAITVIQHDTRIDTFAHSQRPWTGWLIQVFLITHESAKWLTLNMLDTQITV